MRRQISPGAKIARRVNDSVAEMISPDTIDDDARRERIVLVRNRPGQLQSPAAVGEGFAMIVAQDREELSRDFGADHRGVAALKNVRRYRLRRVFNRHRPRRAAGVCYDQRIDCLLKRGVFHPIDIAEQMMGIGDVDMQRRIRAGKHQPNCFYLRIGMRRGLIERDNRLCIPRRDLRERRWRLTKKHESRDERIFQRQATRLLDDRAGLLGKLLRRQRRKTTPKREHGIVHGGGGCEIGFPSPGHPRTGWLGVERNFKIFRDRMRRDRLLCREQVCGDLLWSPRRRHQLVETRGDKLIPFSRSRGKLGFERCRLRRFWTGNERTHRRLDRAGEYAVE